MTPPRLPASRQPLRLLHDRIATGLITAGGIAVLLAILAIGVFLVWEALPLLGFGEALSLATLSPLAWGTLKAALAAMLFATPIALGAAMYSALFMSSRLRSRIKPVMELMEAIPGVVIGFIAGLLLAPWVERHLASTLLVLAWLPLSAALAGALWHMASSRWRQRLPRTPTSSEYSVCPPTSRIGRHRTPGRQPPAHRAHYPTDTWSRRTPHQSD